MVLGLCLFTFLSATAQSFTQRIQQHAAGQGTVTVHQNDSIDNLVNNAILSNRRIATQPGRPTQPGSSTQQNQAAKQNQNEQKTDEKQESEDNGSTDEVRVVHGSYKVMGYRVQAFAGGNSRVDRQKAERTRNNIKSYYPNVPVYVHFYSPRWICRVGNYRTYEEAYQMMTSLKDLGFDQCTIVKGKIQVAY